MGEGVCAAAPTGEPVHDGLFGVIAVGRWRPDDTGPALVLAPNAVGTPRALASASKSSFADWNRCSGGRDAARTHQESNVGGRSPTTDDGIGIGWIMIFIRRS